MMRDDAERSALHLRIDRLGRGEEIQVAVEIGEPFGLLLLCEHVALPRRRAGKIIFDQAARGPRGRDLVIGGLEVREPHRDQRGQSERGQRLMAGVAEAQHPQPRARTVPLQRPIEGQTTRQVVVVEIGAIDALSHEPCQISAESAERSEKDGQPAQIPRSAPNYRRDHRLATSLSMPCKRLKLREILLRDTQCSGRGAL